MSDVDLEAEDLLKGDQKIIAEAKRRFNRAETWEGTARRRYLQDLKFVNGDAYNHYQWPNEVYTDRDGADRPCLTVNKTRQHCLQIINDARQNKTQVRIKPVGDQATYDAAQIYEGLVRRIEYLSNADAIYSLATRHQVHGGIGYWRIVTEYTSNEPNEDAFNQEILLKPVVDPLTIFLDPDIEQQDGSDARFGFVFKRLSKDLFKAQYPQYADKLNDAPLGYEDTWTTEDQVMIAEYFRKTQSRDELIAFTDESTGQQQTLRMSELKKLGKDAVKLITESPGTRKRAITEDKVEWFKIIGEEIVGRRDWPGKYIPIVRVIGEETIIDGELDRKGHVRALVDPQRMYNYNASAEVEYGALQSKSPYLAPVQAIEGLETYWTTANTVNHSVLPYNHKDDEGNDIPSPERATPPGTAAAYIEGMQAAANDMMLVSGQYQENVGQESNAKSGIAIQERQRQGDNATYHYIDHLAMAIRFTGKIIIDLAPKIYDTPRVLKILQEDGTELHVKVDPSLPQAHQQIEDAEEAQISAVFNPKMGAYEVQADVGPAFATRRQEAFNALSQIAAQNPQLMMLIGDLVLKAADFPMADEAAERLKNMVPPQALGTGPSPAETQLQQQNQALHGLLSKMTEELTDAKSKASAATEKRDIGAFDAVTKRLQVLLDHFGLSAADAAQLTHEAMMQDRASGLTQLEDVNRTALAMTQASHAAELQPAQQPQQGQAA